MIADFQQMSALMSLMRTAADVSSSAIKTLQENQIFLDTKSALRIFIFSVSALGPTTNPALARDATDDARAILNSMKEASGGSHWDAVKSLKTTMAVAEGGQIASSEHWEDLVTGRYVVHSAWPAHTTEEGFDGVTSWHQGRSGVAYTLGDVDAELVAADESYRISRGWWFHDRHSATVVFSGEHEENGRTLDVLDITPEGGRVFKAWIDEVTHLLVRTDEQQAEDHVVTTYSDYRPVQGLMLPFTIRIGDGVDPSFDSIQTVKTVEVNLTVPDPLYSIPPRPPSDVEMPPQRDSVNVPFRLTADNRIMVPLTVNGRETLQAEFDSGGGLILQPSAVVAMGVKVDGESKQMGGGEGATTASDGQLETVALGDALVHNVGFHSFAFAPEQPDTALVGLEILQRFVVRFDFDRQVMTLTKPDTFAYHGDGKAIAFHFQDNQPEVKGSIDGIAGLFAVDTGDGGSLLLIAPFARRYRLVDRYHADLPYDGKAVSATHGVWARKRVGTVTFDGPDGRPLAEVHDPITRISLQHSGFDANRNVSANIGLGILKQFNLTFDYVRQQLILEPNRLYGQRDVFNHAGLRLKREGATWTISAIYPGSPAEEAGLKTGDIVSRVDGQSPDALGMPDLWGKLKAPVGTKLQLDVRATGIDHPVVLVLREDII